MEAASTQLVEVVGGCEVLFQILNGESLSPWENTPQFCLVSEGKGDRKKENEKKMCFCKLRLKSRQLQNVP